MTNMLVFILSLLFCLLDVDILMSSITLAVAETQVQIKQLIIYTLNKCKN